MRGTHIGNREFDRILVTRSLVEDQRRKKDLVFSRIANFSELVIVGDRDHDHFGRIYKIPVAERDISDHYPIMAKFVIK